MSLYENIRLLKKSKEKKSRSSLFVGWPAGRRSQSFTTDVQYLVAGLRWNSETFLRDKCPDVILCRGLVWCCTHKRLQETKYLPVCILSQIYTEINIENIWSWKILQFNGCFLFVFFNFPSPKHFRPKTWVLVDPSVVGFSPPWHSNYCGSEVETTSSERATAS